MQNDEPVRISVVSYLNTLPFVYGIEHSASLKKHDFNVTKDIPSVCAEKLFTGQTDIGLVPVVAISAIKNAEIITDFCIGAEGTVKTVMLLSDVPLSEIKTVLLDYQSRTSVKLVQVLAKNLWKISPVFLPAQVGFEAQIHSTTAGVVIGDRIFNLLDTDYPYRYDLAEEWFKMTGLPFVFAAWVSSQKLNNQFLSDFNSALNFGINHIDDVVREYNIAHANNSIPLLHYLTKDISYSLSEQKREAMQLFLNFLET